MVMQTGMEQGVNPRDVAADLAEIFEDRNSDWERLARTEMAGAAERAKMDEWEERGVNVDAIYRQDAEGNDAVIIPVHPRCRCSSTIKDDGNGNLRAVFAPAPDACAWCFSYQEGDKAMSARLRRSAVLVGKRTQEWYQKWAELSGEARTKKGQSAITAIKDSQRLDESYKLMTAAIEKLADRPINIKIYQAPLQLSLEMKNEKTAPRAWTGKKNPDGTITMEPKESSQ